MKKKYYIMGLFVLIIIVFYIIITFMNKKTLDLSMKDAIPPPSNPNFIINTEVWER